MHVGSEGKNSIGFTPDNTGDNISSQNYTFSEMTGLYWAWKNLKCDYLGFVHYRRYFAAKSKFGTADPEAALTGEEAQKLLFEHKILLPRRRKYYIETLYSHYAHTADGRHLDVAREIISRKCPEYIESFDEVMRQSWGWMFNMFIMPKIVADEYCEWVFGILFDLSGKVGIDNMNAFEMRYPARVAELLFNVWINYQLRIGSINPENVFEIPYIYTEKINWPRKIIEFLTAKFFHRKYKKSF